MPKASELWVIAAVLVTAGIATVVDLRTGRIPNALVAGSAVVGLALAACGLTEPTSGEALVGLVVGGALLVPGHVLGGTGAGDVKLAAALGTFLGPQRIVLAILYAAIAGGVLAGVVAARRGRLHRTLVGAMRVATRRAGAADEIKRAGDNRYAYGPAILIGAVMALLGG